MRELLNRNLPLDHKTLLGMAGLAHGKFEGEV